MPLAERNNLVLDYLTESNAESVAPLFMKSFHAYEYFQRMMPDTPQAAKAWAEATQHAIDDPNTICLVVTDTSTGAIVAHGRWVRPKAEGEKDQPGNEEDRWGDSFMEACDLKMAEDLFGAFHKNREQFMGEEKHWCKCLLLSESPIFVLLGPPDSSDWLLPCLDMELLLTHPDYQGKGCGSMILRHGLELADRDQLPCYIDSSSMGKALYEKLGWTLDHKKDFDYGLSYYFGVRQPQITS